MPTRLVVDASIAISAGESEHPTSSRCREFLRKVIKGDFLVVMTNEIESEWKDPEKPSQTRNSIRWLRRLYGERKVEWQEDVYDSELRNAIDVLDELLFNADIRLLMLEDIHLIEAALVTDRNITSRDDKVRRHFKRAAANIAGIQEIVWVNPVTEEDCLVWLENNCPIEERRQLIYTDEEHL